MNSHWDDEVANETLVPLNTPLYPQTIPKKTPQERLRLRELRKLKESRELEEEKNTKPIKATQVEVASKESLAWLAHLDTTPWSLNF